MPCTEPFSAPPESSRTPTSESECRRKRGEALRATTLAAQGCWGLRECVRVLCERERERRRQRGCERFVRFRKANPRASQSEVLRTVPPPTRSENTWERNRRSQRDEWSELERTGKEVQNTDALNFSAFSSVAAGKSSESTPERRTRRSSRRLSPRAKIQSR